MISEVDPELNEIAADLTRLYRDSIPVYDRVNRDTIEQNTRAVLSMVVAQLHSDSAHTSLDELAALARTWADQQIPLELVAHSIQLGARRIFGVIRERATTQALPATTIDEMQDLTWEWATAYAAAVHTVLQERAVAGATRRADFLRRLVDGGLSPTALTMEARNHHVNLHHSYLVACTAWDETAATSDLLAALRARCSTPDLPVIDAVLDMHLVALLPRTADGLLRSGPVGLGPAALPADVPSSYQHARRALEIATRYGRNGLVDLASLGPLPLLGLGDDAASMLAEQHLAPLLDSGAAGQEIATTVATFLDCDRRVDDTATKLYIHRNTVRNRLTRFGELTGLDIDRTDDLVLAWWLLNRDRAAAAQ
ncbi:PucR family transcriptional regulator [Rhodococcus tibetensis]|uniref:Helix-turn-helix domain-containing protein n=1 Tax=Rhodococcus tibetensis TaxID=2965064 RepID=A0ABT1QHY3_9NOCA|nr:helix-turn-helix domain-containing protein [Rhodococcus sp. FXJ9.536]MCQ4121865.1 helix-turn-helix domain-containing protein [Rhodococcus sp. FXJ9.536]